MNRSFSLRSAIDTLSERSRRTLDHRHDAGFESSVLRRIKDHFFLAFIQSGLDILAIAGS